MNAELIIELNEKRGGLSKDNLSIANNLQMELINTQY
jgi:hypothetical protein